MTLSYTTAVEELLALGHELASGPSARPKFDLETMRALVAAMGHPERAFPSVLVAGTNGKGSTSATLASILHAAGYRTGLYTSPHLIRVNERIQVNGLAIGDAAFAEVHAQVKAVGEQLVRRGELPLPPSFFETLTAMAFQYFSAAGIEIAVLEVGLGGRLDATNIVSPMLSVITDIALDHQEWLGETIAEIAREKAGILRPNGTLVTLPQHPEANRVLGDVATELGVEAVNAARFVPSVSPGAEKVPGVAPRSSGFRNQYPLDVMGTQIAVDSPLAGRYQFRNAALAIAAAEQLQLRGFHISATDIEEGIRTTRWPGRLQLISGQGRHADVLLDVAHNPAGSWALRSALSENLLAEDPAEESRGARPITLVFGAMRDKPIAEMSEILFPLATTVIATRAESPRSASAEAIKAAARHLGDDVIATLTVRDALDRAFASTPKNGVVVVTGSVYVVGAALAELQREGLAMDASMEGVLCG